MNSFNRLNAWMLDAHLLRLIAVPGLRLRITENAMRIVAGEFRGRRLSSPKDAKIRPTADRVREAIFSIIGPGLSEAHILDLFAGSGALGLEALSRGAASAVFVDKNLEAIRLIHANIELCRAQDRSKVILGPARQVIQRLAGKGELFDVIFMDPPYGKGYVEKTLSFVGVVARTSAQLIAEHHAKEVVPSECQDWRRMQERRYGDTAISIYVNESSR